MKLCSRGSARKGAVPCEGNLRGACGLLRGFIRELRSFQGGVTSSGKSALECGTARNLLPRPPHRKRSERGRAPGSEGVWELSRTAGNRGWSSSSSTSGSPASDAMYDELPVY